MVARVATFVGLKGGSGRTTTTANLAAAYAARGRRVLVVDLDQQANATDALGAERDNGDGLLEVLAAGESIIDSIRPSLVPGVEVVSGGVNLRHLDARIAADPILGGAVNDILRDALAPVLMGFDHILIDCPPGVGTVSVMALMAANDALIPCEPHPHGAAGVRDFLQVVDSAMRRSRRLERARVILTRVDGRTVLSRSIIEALRANLGAVVCVTEIRSSIKVAEAALDRRPIVHAHPREAAAQDYDALATELDIMAAPREEGGA